MTTLFDPPPPTNSRALRPYQRDAMAALDKAFFEDNRTNTVLSLPPSGGKTFTASQWMYAKFLQERPGSKILWVAHREELIEQARDDCLEYCPGAKVTTWYQGGKDITGDIVVASVPSYRSLLTALEEAGIKFILLVIDECHHAAADTYQAVIDGTPHLYRLGLSGTPKRTDGKLFSFDHIAYQVKFRELYEAGWCARPVYKRYRTKQNHLFQVRAGDFTAGSLRSLNNAPRNAMVVREFFDHPEHWPAMVYTVNVDHAWALRKDLQEAARARGKSCRVCVVTGETPKDERRMIVEDFRAGKVDALLNCMVFTEGTDLPTIRSIYLTRPTMSETLWLQMALRGGRSKPGYQATGNDPTPGLDPKNHFYIVDFVDSAHHYVAASRGFALRALDPKEVNAQTSVDDIEKAQKLVAEMPGAYEAFKQQFKGIKFEEEELTPEEWMLSKVGATVLTSSPWFREKPHVLTAEQDFALMCGEEYVWKRWENARLPKSEAVALLRRAYDLFAKDVFEFPVWRELLEAWISHKRFRNTVQPTNGGRTYLHQSAVESPPLQEVYEAIEEIEKEAAKVDDLFEDAHDVWDKVRAMIQERAPAEHKDYWRQQLDRVHSVSWGDKQLSFVFDGTPNYDDGWFVKILVLRALQKLTDRTDVVVVMSFSDNTFAACPCGGKLILREGRNGQFFGCTKYPACKHSGQPPSKTDLANRMRLKWYIPG